MKRYYVYILTNKRNGILYTGVTSNLQERVYQHKNKLAKGFTSKYKISKLVYFEETSDVEIALQREKQLKRRRRAWKLKLIEEKNSK